MQYRKRVSKDHEEMSRIKSDQNYEGTGNREASSQTENQILLERDVEARVKEIEDRLEVRLEQMQKEAADYKEQRVTLILAVLSTIASTLAAIVKIMQS